MAMIAAEAAGAAGAGAAETGAATAGRAAGGSRLAGATQAAAGVNPSKPMAAPGSRPAGQGGPTRNNRKQGGTREKLRKADRAASRVGSLRLPRISDPEKLVLAEFLVCVAVMIIKPFGKDPKHASESSLLQGSAIAATFFVLALMTSGGRSSSMAKAAAAFGGIVTLGVIFRAQDSFKQLANFFADAKAGKTVASSATSAATSGVAAGAAAGKAAEQQQQSGDTQPPAGAIGQQLGNVGAIAGEVLGGQI